MSVEERNPNYCWAHHVVEEPGYLRCGECFHWFPSKERLEYDYNFKAAMDNVFCTPRTAEEIFFCPHCAHDF